jgi:hypothetical protein
MCFFVVTRVTVKISLGSTWASGRPGPSCEMMRDLKTFSVKSMISSTAVESEDSPLNRQVVINRPCSIRHFQRELSPASGGSIIQVPSARYGVSCRCPCHVPIKSRDKVASSGSASAMTGTIKASKIAETLHFRARFVFIHIETDYERR